MRRTRLWFILPLVFLLNSCQDSTISSPDRPLRLPVNAAIVDGGHGGNPHAWWLAPQWIYSSFPGTAVTDLSPLVKVCKWTGTACTGTEFTFKRSNSTLFVGFVKDYNALWRFAAANPQVGDVYRATVHLSEHDAPTPDNTVLVRDLIFVRNKREADQIGYTNSNYTPIILSGMGPGSNYLLRFRLEEGVATATVDLGFDCPTTNTADCFENTYTFEQGGDINTSEDGELDEAAFAVQWSNVKINGEPAGEGDSFTLVIAEKTTTGGICVPTFPGEQKGACVVYKTVPENVTFEDAEENPQGRVQVCPDGNPDGFDLVKHDDGQFTFPPPAADIFECPSPIIGKMPGFIRGLAKLLLPRAAYADDEGETGTVRNFSEVFWGKPTSLVGDQDNFGFGAAPVPLAFYDNGVIGTDLGIFDRELTTGDEVESWTHDLSAIVGTGFTARHVTIEISEIFSDPPDAPITKNGASLIVIDGSTFDFEVNGSSKQYDGSLVISHAPVLQTFNFNGDAANFASDGVVNITFNENNDDVSLDYAKITIRGTTGTGTPVIITQVLGSKSLRPLSTSELRARQTAGKSAGDGLKRSAATP